MENGNPVAILHVGKLVTARSECLCVVHSLSPREAMVRTSLPLEIGQSVTLGLRNGFAVSAIVGVIMGEHISLLFEEHVSITTILAEQRDARSEREAVRLTMIMPISITTQNGVHMCMMQDISLSGVKVSDELNQLTEGTQVQILIDGLGKRDAVVRWYQHPYAGISFEVPLGFKLLDEWTVGRMSDRRH